MKVLFFIRSLTVGGSQRQVVMLAEGLMRRGHGAAIAVFYTGGEIDVARRSSTLRVIPLGKRDRWDVVRPLLRLRQLLRNEQPDFIYAFQPTQTAVAALLLPRGTGTRLIFGIRAAGVDASRYDRLSALAGRLEARLARRADLIIANSRAAKSDAIARGMPAERIPVVPNGIDTQAMAPDAAAGRAQRRAWGIADDAFVIGCVARFDPMKDHMTLIAAAALFCRQNHNARFVCIGYGPVDYVARLKAAADQAGLGDRIMWIGAMGGLHAAYNAFDIATLSSSFGESFPNVVGEAMACGIPVAATDSGDIKQIIGEVGEVAQPRQPKALCAAWDRLRRRLEANPGLRVAVRETVIANYSAETMVQRTEQIFAALLARRPPADIARSAS